MTNSTTNITIQAIRAANPNILDWQQEEMYYEALVAQREELTTSTNSTTSTKENTTMNTINTTTMNTNALSSTVMATIFHKIDNAKYSAIIACGVVDAAKQVGDLDMPEAFVELVVNATVTAKLQTTLTTEGNPVERVDHNLAITAEFIEEVLVLTDIANEDGTMGNRMIEMLEQRTESYAPIKEGQAWTRRFPMIAPEKGQMGGLAIEAFHALEASLYTKDDYMTHIANRVQDILGGAEKDDEAYVLAGCNVMDSKQGYFSEFKADRRIRAYQACCHGGNGQASDRSRALMDLHGVTLDYDIEVVKQAIKAEVLDMVNVASNEVGKLMMAAFKNPVDFIVAELAKKKKERLAAKPWSFVKAARTWILLARGERPYIGMAVGLDAKCSGPQLGAMMVGDAEIAAACGMTLTKLQDAYQRCIEALDAAGLKGFTRSGIKKSFMGIFYGQGWEAFTQINNLIKEEQDEVVAVLYPNGKASDDVAKKFHKVVSNSFGKKMVALRERIKEFNGEVEGRTGHMMPDGSRVQMNYKVKKNINDERIERGTDLPDVVVTTGEFTYKFIKLSLNTTEVSTSDFIRTAFVNMIQATDALVARLIIVHLSRLGAQHIISVHDCFRVNVTEMHLLKQAIKNAYQDLFGSRTNIKTADLPLGTDILEMFFAGLQDAVPTSSTLKVTPMTQFLQLKSGEVRKMTKINGVQVTDLIERLGESYYFDK
tara:strand:- start:934 stop:3072 length:2139 start_codon:yes stop_codon:yes gene_type:complete